MSLHWPTGLVGSKRSLPSTPFCPTGLNYTKRSAVNRHFLVVFVSFHTFFFLLTLTFLPPNSALSFFFCFKRQKNVKEINTFLSTPVESKCCGKQQEHEHYKRHCIIYPVLSYTAQVKSEWFKKLGGAVREIVSISSLRPSISGHFSREFSIQS